ncbi:MAG: hypothetical protein FJW35_10565 [Acidobacteria bacterium]|nr:hypothetical protein [Acidobacteriota bacterium]
MTDAEKTRKELCACLIDSYGALREELAKLIERSGRMEAASKELYADLFKEEYPDAGVRYPFVCGRHC